MAKQEEWRDIKGYEGLYQVSNLGRVRSVQRIDSLGRRKNKKILKPFLTPEGYLKIDLYNGTHKKFFIHRLVAKEFLPVIEGKFCVNHIDANKRNNNSDNLEWVTHSENTQHAKKVGLLKWKYGEYNGRSKLTNEEVDIIRKEFIPFSRKYGVQALSRKYNVSHSTIYDILHHKTYKEI